MRLFKGFLMSKDPETGKLSPFFLKVRNEDIFVSKKISMDKTFHQTSEIWTLENESHATDMSIFDYKFDDSYKNWQGLGWSAAKEIVHGELAPADLFSGHVLYKIYKSGYYEVQCIFYFRELTDGSNNQSVIVVPLPYALRNVMNVSPYMMPLYNYRKNTASMMVSIGNDNIENTVLSINDSELYTYKIQLTQVWNMYMAYDTGSGLNPCNNNPKSSIGTPYVSFTINGFLDNVYYE